MLTDIDAALRSREMENPLSEDNKEALLTFLDKRDRGVAFRFVGRNDILTTVERQLRLAREEQRSLPNADVVQGAPGSGKSVLFKELKERYLEAASVVPVMLSGEDLNNKVSVAEAFVAACGIDANALHHSTTKRISGTFGFSWIGASIDSNKHLPPPSEQIQTGRSSIWSALSRYLDIPKDTTFLVLVDETQRVEPDPDSANNNTAIKLADGSTGTMKTCVVFGGLSDTSSRLKRVGVSPRLASDSVHRLGALTKEETQELVHAFLTHEPFGLDTLALDQDGIIKTITSASDCYPRHVQSYLRGIAWECANEASFDVGRAVNRGEAMRVSFYEEIVRDAELQDFRHVLSAAAQSSGPNGTIKFDELARIAAEQLEMPRAEVWQATEQAVHGGVLEEDLEAPSSGDSLKFPVPSLQTYASTGFDRTRTLSLLRAAEARGEH